MNGVRGSFLVVVAGLALLTACAGDQADDEINFLRAKPSDAPDMAALYEGRLMLSEKCLYLESGDGSLTHAAIWPLEFSLTEGGGVQILNEDEAVVARVGDEIRVGGGEARGFSAEDLEENFIGNAAQCKPPYWRISDVEVVSP